MDRCQILLWHLNTIHDWQKLAFLSSFFKDIYLIKTYGLMIQQSIRINIQLWEIVSWKYNNFLLNFLTPRIYQSVADNTHTK